MPQKIGGFTGHSPDRWGIRPSPPIQHSTCKSRTRSPAKPAIHGSEFGKIDFNGRANFEGQFRAKFLSGLKTGVFCSGCLRCPLKKEGKVRHLREKLSPGCPRVVRWGTRRGAEKKVGGFFRFSPGTFPRALVGGMSSRPGGIQVVSQYCRCWFSKNFPLVSILVGNGAFLAQGKQPNGLSPLIKKLFARLVEGLDCLYYD